MSLHGFPDDLKIDISVVVNDAIPHGKLGAGLGGEPCRRFPGDQEAPQDGILRLGVVKELRMRLSGNIAPNSLGRPADVEEGKLPV